MSASRKTPAQRPHVNGPHANDARAPSAQDKQSFIRELTPARRIDVQGLEADFKAPDNPPPFSDDARMEFGEEEVPTCDDPQIEFTEEEVPTTDRLLTLESFRSLPEGDVWPDLDWVEGDQEAGSIEDAPETIREERRVPSDVPGFDERIREYLGAARTTAGQHLVESKKKSKKK